MRKEMTMITKEGLIFRLEKENIKADILDFKYFKTDDFVWFAFSFEEGHTLNRKGLDPETEDDVYLWLCGDTEDDYREAVNAIKFSRISPYKDCGADMRGDKDENN